MNKVNSVIIYLIIFVFGAVFLRISGIVDFTSIELLSYIMMFAGIAAVYTSFGRDRKGLLFIGSTVFLTAIIVYVNSRFDLEDTKLILFPSVLFIIGIGFTLLYIDNTADRLFIILSSVFIAAGIIFMLFYRISAFVGFFESLVSFIKSYWLILVIAAGLLFIIRKET